MTKLSMAPETVKPAVAPAPQIVTKVPGSDESPAPAPVAPQK